MHWLCAFIWVSVFSKEAHARPPKSGYIYICINVSTFLSVCLKLYFRKLNELNLKVKTFSLAVASVMFLSFKQWKPIRWGQDSWEHGRKESSAVVLASGASIIATEQIKFSIFPHTRMSRNNNGTEQFQYLSASEVVLLFSCQATFKKAFETEQNVKWKLSNLGNCFKSKNK